VQRCCFRQVARTLNPRSHQRRLARSSVSAACRRSRIRCAQQYCGLSWGLSLKNLRYAEKLSLHSVPSKSLPSKSYKYFEPLPGAILNTVRLGQACLELGDPLERVFELSPKFFEFGFEFFDACVFVHARIVVGSRPWRKHDMLDAWLWKTVKGLPYKASSFPIIRRLALPGFYSPSLANE